MARIANEQKFQSAFDYLKQNQHIYDQWFAEWKQNKPKEVYVRALRSYYALFSSFEKKNEELFLLLGDIAHYLYNLDDTAYYQIAVDNYSLAIRSEPKDFRGYWFLAFHYSQSSVLKLSIDNFLKAQELLPQNCPADFWDEFGWASVVANMPSHCLFAMEQVRRISGHPGNFEKATGPSIYKQIIKADKDKSYKKEAIWSLLKDTKSEFISRTLGIKLAIDTTWDITAYDYKNYRTAFIITPPAIANASGKKIGFTIAVIVKVADSTESLADYIDQYIVPYSGKTAIHFSDRYSKMIAWEIRDKNLYKDLGGGHMYMIGIERDQPPYPGLVLETASELPRSDSQQVNYYTGSNFMDRFKGRIFYAILLDSCEDIHQQSLDIFRSFFNDMVIE